MINIPNLSSVWQSRLIRFFFLGPSYVFLQPDGHWRGRGSSVLSNRNEYSAAKVFDGSVKTFFHSIDADTKFHWIQLNLGKSVQVIFLACML